MNQIINFAINSRSAIFFYIESLSLDSFNDKINIFYEDGDNKVLLFNGSIQVGVRSFRLAIEQVLSDDKRVYLLDEDIGLIQNELISTKPVLIKSKIENYRYYEYQLFEPINKNPFFTWLYQNIMGEIIFKITPNYFCIDITSTNSKLLPYELWIEFYKLSVEFFIDKSIAESWQKKNN